MVRLGYEIVRNIVPPPSDGITRQPDKHGNASKGDSNSSLHDGTRSFVWGLLTVMHSMLLDAMVH